LKLNLFVPEEDLSCKDSFKGLNGSTGLEGSASETGLTRGGATLAGEGTDVFAGATLLREGTDVFAVVRA
jgi:hypothetical protein